MAHVITQERLQFLLDYNPKTGEFVWKNSASRRARNGSVAGSLTNYGYITIRADGRAYLAHRLAWFYVHGVWPTGEVDHKNTITTDNWLLNLRDVSEQMNRQNIRTAKCTSKSGLLGVRTAPSGKSEARISVNRKDIHLGMFDTPEKAHEAYVAAKRQHHQGCTL